MTDDQLHVGRPNMGSRERFHALVDDIFDRRWLTNDGPMVRDLENRLKEHLGVRNVVAMANGTIALEIAIRALGLTGEVIVPSFTFVATAHALHWQGITPMFADIDPTTHNLDPDAVRSMISPRTTGIIGVHLWGRPAPVEALQQLADEHGLRLLFDAAHAFSNTHRGQRIGRFGDAEVFSFHATKFFNTFEGGAIATDDDDLAERTRLMRNFGFAGYDNVIHPGTNGKMTEICAAMGLVNLAEVENVIRSNLRRHTAYTEGLAGLPDVRVMRYDTSERCNHQYVVALIGPQSRSSRDAVLTSLHDHGILARRYFWPGVHRMQPYADLFPQAETALPATDEVASQVLVLPTGPTVTVEDIHRVVDVMRAELAQ